MSLHELMESMLLSLRIAVAATVLVAVLGIPLAYMMARLRFAGRSLLDAALTVPLVLPPTVVGFGLILFLGRQSFAGQWLERLFGLTIMFNVGGAALASAVVALPLLYLPAKSAFASVDRDLEDIARLLGANPLQIFWHVSLPLARRGIAAGLLLAFARALGEFGATVMVLGITQTTTLPISIYVDVESNRMAAAIPAVIVLLALSMLMIFVYNRWGVGPRT
jgi:molybdate transport system permease protein